MSLYLDASVLVSLFLRDSHTDRAAAMVAAVGSEAIVIDFARAEFAAVMGRLQRTGELTIPAISAVKVWTSPDSQVSRRGGCPTG